MRIDYAENVPWASNGGQVAYTVTRVGQCVGATADGAVGTATACVDSLAQLTRGPAAALHNHIGYCLGMQANFAAAGQPTKVWAMPVGAAWSFNPIVGSPVMLLQCAPPLVPVAGQEALSGVAWIGAQDLHADSGDAPGEVALLLGGTRLRQLVAISEPRGRSLHTSGTHLGASVAGLIATSSHGSRLGYGGIQNQVAGLMLVTGAQRSVWIEPASRPLLSDASAAALDDAISIIRDDAMFADALVHLGGMGIVCAVALRTVANDSYRVRCAKQAIDGDWLDQVASGDFDAIAARLGHAGSPCFYEMTVDPRGPGAGGAGLWRAYHTLYYPDATPAADHAAITLPRASAAFFHKIGGAVAADGAPETAMAPATSVGGSAPPPAAPPAPPPPDSIIGLFDGVAYFEANIFNHFSHPTDQPLSWGQIHGDTISGGLPGGLSNASFAIDRRMLPQVLQRMSDAVRGLHPHFIFTVRFVSGAAGTMAFTRFADTAVVEIDGLSRTGYRYVFQGDPLAETFPVETEQAIARVRAELDRADDPVDYRMHWGKLGWWGDRAKLAAAYGPADDPQSPLARWRRTRAALIDPACDSLFRNAGLTGWGVVPDA